MTPEQIGKKLTHDPMAEVPLNTREMLAAWIAREIKQEREACARIAETPPEIGSLTDGAFDRGYLDGRREAAKAIRNRKS